MSREQRGKFRTGGAGPRSLVIVNELDEAATPIPTREALTGLKVTPKRSYHKPAESWARHRQIVDDLKPSRR
jgi:hypothetical protein